MNTTATTVLTRTEFQNLWKKSTTNKEIKRAVTEDGPRNAFGRFLPFIERVWTVFRPDSSEVISEWGLTKTALRSTLSYYNISRTTNFPKELVEFIRLAYQAGMTISGCQIIFGTSFEQTKWAVHDLFQDKHDLSQYDVEQFRQWFMDRYSLKDIAKEIGATQYAVKKHIQSLNIEYSINLLRDDIQSMVCQGIRVSEISSRLNLNRATVSKYMHRWGVRYNQADLDRFDEEDCQRRLQASRKGANQVKQDREQRFENWSDRVITLANQGLTNEEIANDVGISDLTVAKVLQSYGVEYKTREEYAHDRAVVAYQNAISSRTSDGYDYSQVTFEKWINNVRIPIGCPIHGVFWQRRDNHFRGGAGCPACANVGPSKSEQQVADYVRSLGVSVAQSDRNLLQLGKKELDVLVPSRKLAIEYNGLFWHSAKDDIPQNKKRHVEKTQRCDQLGWQLLHINSDEWEDPIKQSIWKSVIACKLQCAERLYARNLTVRNVPRDQANRFLNENHLQGSVNGTTIGLYNADVLVMVLTYGKSRFERNKYEILRMCSAKHTVVVGGASRLISKLRQLVPAGVSIVSYANRRWSQGNVYQQCGFEHIRDTSPNYWYISQGHTCLSRMSCQKHKLPHLLGDLFDPTKTEMQNMLDAGYQIMYDCGNRKYEMTN